MTLQAFKESLNLPDPPSMASELLLALWYDGKGLWERSHNIAQDIHSKEGSWIHAYLHRKEGDLGNAGYWYHKAGKPVCHVSLEQEWEDIAKALLG